MTTTTLIAALSALSSDGRELVGLPQAVGWLEVRADQTGDVHAQWLRQFFPGRLLYSLRAQACGDPTANGEDRRKRLIAAARHFDLVELDAECDLSADVLEAIPPSMRLVSWYGTAADEAAMLDRFQYLARVPARYYKLVPATRKVTDGLLPLGLLHALGRDDVVAHASGQAGFWSRPLAAHFGSPFTFAALTDEAAEDGEPSVQRLTRDYHLPELGDVTEIYGIVGNPILHSLSPRLHNAAYRELQLPGIFLPFHAESFGDFWSTLIQSGSLERLGLTPNGFTVASPHKETVLASASKRGTLARQAMSSNITFRNNGAWKAETTDPEGVLFHLKRRSIDVAGRKVAVIGCGGSGRAIAAALIQTGADVTLVNRSLERGRRAVDLLQLPFVPMSEFSPQGFSMLVNATPVGRNGESLPFEIDDMERDAVVVDLVYGRDTTPLVSRFRQRGGVSIDGRDVLLAQVARQFQVMTGRTMPAGIGRRLVGRTSDNGKGVTTKSNERSEMTR